MTATLMILEGIPRSVCRAGLLARRAVYETWRIVRPTNILCKRNRVSYRFSDYLGRGGVRRKDGTNFTMASR